MAKQRGCINRILFWGNVLTALLLLVSFVLPYLPPRRFPNVALLSLGVSPLLLVNALFLLYWLVQLSRRALLSVVVLLFAYFHFNPFFEISTNGNTEDYKNTLSVVSYNVRLFNAYEKGPDREVTEVISQLLDIQQPDVLCIQEFYKGNKLDFSSYPHKYVHYKGARNNLGHAIFSKYPLVKTGTFDFRNSYNNALYADVVKNGDTVRVYNIHLQSLGIKPNVDYLQQGDKDKLRRRMARAFLKQQQQMEEIVAHKNRASVPVILAGDFNNTAFSYVYRKLQQDMKDAFVEGGSGLGTTFLFEHYPMRIDYILVSEELDVVRFETGDSSFSDHFPINAVVGWQ
ncbi:MAG: endonuclease [Flavobacteriaceae bacterium]|nr:endonuclease [Flavobacteriaceae bacterium]